MSAMEGGRVQGSGDTEEALLIDLRRAAPPLSPPEGLLVRTYAWTSSSQALSCYRFYPGSATGRAGWSFGEQAWSLATLFRPD